MMGANPRRRPTGVSDTGCLVLTLTLIGAAVAAWVLSGPGPDDVRRASPVLSPGGETPAAERQRVKDENMKLRAKLRCVRQYEADGWADDVDAMRGECGIEAR